ncbi:MAG: threonine-phosphate decarboxylase CobD [Thermodesulfovibrionales bacterium]|nr:threonine-phosphate decarboxylase CobD [Thermodesulfovibrionales bacterium]
MSGHGGNIYRFAKDNNLSEKQVIDFSASINPLGIPKSVILQLKKIDKSFYHYPDPDTLTLKETISRFYEIPLEAIICGNGSTELIYLCVRALKPKKVLIPAPTFSEYERACLLLDADIKYFWLKKENNFNLDPDEYTSHMTGCQMAFICNPNNPTGCLIDRNGLIKIANSAKDLRCYLILDEAFIDFVSDYSIIHEVMNNPYLIVLRSMTKFYALSAFRLGFGVFHPSILSHILRYKEPWTVNTLAQIAGITALEDQEYKEKTYKVIAEGKAFLEEGFKRLSIRYIPSSVNYYLLEIENAHSIISSLKKANIMVRDCSNFKGLNGSYIRVAVKSEEENKLLLKELAFLCAG